MPTQLPRVPSLMPSSFATRAIGREVSITIFTASSLNSGEKLFFGRGNYFTFPDCPSYGWTVRKARGTSQLMERYRRGKAWRAKSGSVNVLSGAPFGYRYVRKNPETGARYEIVPHEAVLVAEMFRRYADDGASIADLGRWLTAQGVPTRTG